MVRINHPVGHQSYQRSQSGWDVLRRVLMTLKKMLLVAGMALTAIAFAAPAAQAQLTFNAAEESYEGTLQFHRPAGVGGVPPTGVFHCNEVTVKVVSPGGTDASVTEFKPTTATCAGEAGGLFQGCVLKEDTSNIPFTATTTATDINVTKPGGDIDIHNKYEKCAFGITESTISFGSVTVVPDPGTGPISTLTVSGTTTAGGITASGTLHAEDGEALELFND